MTVLFLRPEGGVTAWRFELDNQLVRITLARLSARVPSEEAIPTFPGLTLSEP